MRKLIKPALLVAGLLPAIASAQDVDRTKYPDYSSEVNPDFSLLKHSVVSARNAIKADEVLPDHVNNANTKYFPPVFNQDGGSCGSASRICYMFTHEINAYRDVDAKLLSNRYPSHFVWLLTRTPSGKDEFVQFVGVPNAEVYGGTTYSAVFGNQVETQNDFGWMQGYDKWYSGMWNRMLRPAHVPMDVRTEEGRTILKRWLYNHNGDTSFHAGGIAGIGVASSGNWQPIPKSPTNDAIGVTNQQFVKSWGQQVDHALTIVGYDDRIEFDLDENGVVGEKDKDEVGAWIVVNSWGSWWGNKGFIYCPYKHAGPVGAAEGGYWQPEIYKVRKDYRPLRTIKLMMDYSRRSELKLSVGISADLNSKSPEKTIPMHHFIYAGDGANGNTNPAPEIPMLGRWADGKLHDEPMEFGYDLTDLTDGYDKNAPLKYFFIIETKSSALGKGNIYNASIIDYEYDHLGIETPFTIKDGAQPILNKGKKTIISTVVYGETFYAPRNLMLSGNQLKWNAPLPSGHKITGYKLYMGQNLLAEVGADKLNYDLAEVPYMSTYGLTAVYDNGTESNKIVVSTPVVNPEKNIALELNKSGFRVPNVFTNKYNQATIEFWIKPHSLVNYNQTVGPGWGNFMLHANANGSISVGWDTNNRINSAAGKLVKGQWSHIAVVINKNLITLYVNGLRTNTFTSNSYSGIGGFGDLVFSAKGEKNAMDAQIKELRIWNTQKMFSEVRSDKNTQFSGKIMPYGLIAYYKGDFFEEGGQYLLRDYVGGNHAEMLNKDFCLKEVNDLKISDPTTEMEITIAKPNGDIFVGIPVEFEAKYSTSVTQLSWNVDGTDIKNLEITKPSFTFEKPGDYNVCATATNAAGETMTDTCKISVLTSPTPDASFTPTKTRIEAGERVTFIANQPKMGYLYEWYMPGAEKEHSSTMNCATSYPDKGKFTVTLTVTAPNGQKGQYSQEIEVVEVAPISDFEIAPKTIMKGETTFLYDKSKYSPTKWQWLIHGGEKDVIINGQNSSFTPKTPGIYEVTLKTQNNTGSHMKTMERAFVVSNADSKNGLNFTRNNSMVKLSKSPFAESNTACTVEWWMNSSALEPVCCGFGQEGVMVLRATSDGSVTMFLEDKKIATGPGYVTPNEWHHYAVVFSHGSLIFYKDAKQFYKENVGTAKLPVIDKFTISNDVAPFMGQIDEFRIWNTALSVAELETYANAPILDVNKAVEENKLSVYYDFNQSSGNVKDRTASGNDGIRVNFGPEGDAWGLSRGVFSLNTGSVAKQQNVTAQYLKNYKSQFKSLSKSVNGSNSRFRQITDWTLENATVNDNVTTGVHVDNNKNSDFTFTSGWDGFGAIKNHKAYQTVTLPAGSYTFTAKYGQYEGKCGNSFLVVDLGKGLPDTRDVFGALACNKMVERSNTHMSNAVSFVLAEETEVSLGLVINLGDKACCTITEFQLTRSDIEIKEADGANGYEIDIDATEYGTICLPYPTVLPEHMAAFTVKEVKGTQLVLEAINDGIIPANTGVILSAKAGKYHLVPSATSSNATSLLIGTTMATETEANKRYYALDAQDKPGFYLFNGSTLEANRAFLVRESNDTNEQYLFDITQTGIENIEGADAPAEMFDLSGRRVNQPNKGVYISNGKKIYVN